jgi:hypothetical protein
VLSDAARLEEESTCRCDRLPNTTSTMLGNQANCNSMVYAGAC